MLLDNSWYHTNFSPSIHGDHLLAPQCSLSMTSRVLTGRCVISKDQISHERPNANRKHHPSIISHEEQHQHKCIESLHRINYRLDNMRLLVNLHLIASCPQERRRFSNSSNGCVVDLLGNVLFVSAGCGADGFVGCGEGYDGKEGEEKTWGGLYVPPSEDDAEVRGVPGEQHVHIALHPAVHATMSHIAVSHSRMIHVRVIHSVSSCWELDGSDVGSFVMEMEGLWESVI